MSSFEERTTSSAGWIQHSCICMALVASLKWQLSILNILNGRISDRTQVDFSVFT